MGIVFIIIKWFKGLCLHNYVVCAQDIKVKLYHFKYNDSVLRNLQCTKCYKLKQITIERTIF